MVAVEPAADQQMADRHIVVAGMHRSGTSAVMQVLARLGVAVGPFDSLMGASTSNPFGHYEQLPIVDLNEELLEVVGSHWAAPQDRSKMLGELADGVLGDRARGALFELFGESKEWAVKDPRFCLTLPFWLRVFSSDPVLLVPIRQPTAVAQSLNARNKIPESYGVALWDTYYRSLLRSGSHLRRQLIDFDELVNETQLQIRHLADWLGLDLTAIDLADLASTIVSVERHHSARSDMPVSKATGKLLDALDRWGDGESVTVAAPNFKVFEPLAGILAVERQDQSRLRGEISVLKEDLAKANTAIEAAEQRHSEEVERAVAVLADTRSRYDDEVASLRSILADANERHRDEVEGWRSALDAAGSRHSEETERWRSALDEATTRHSEAVDGWRSALEAADARHASEVERLRSALEEAQATAPDAASLLREQMELQQRLREAEAAADHVAAERGRLAEREAELEARVVALEGLLSDRDRELQSIYESRAGRVMRTVWDTRVRARETVHAAASFGPARFRGGTELVPGRSGRDLPSPVHFAPSQTPDISIVVPVHGELEFTARCLDSLVGHETRFGLEVIVVNDASKDATRDWLATCSGIEVVDLTANVGYLRATNEGLQRSRGEFTLLLNNDTVLEAGCIDALMETATSSADIGAVGAKLVYPDGSLQEAGSIIWNDGTGWNYGRGQDPNDYKYDFVREVDYCSAACLLVRRAPFEDLGWFDERYVPAYYEDTDLCFALRDQGLRVMFQPAARVVHFEGISHGTDESSGLKAHQVENRFKFLEKWSAALEQQFPPDTSPRRASWRGTRERVLIFDHEVPAPDQDSGSVRMNAIVSILTELGYRVTFFPHNRTYRERYNERLEASGVEVGHGWEAWAELFEAYGPDLAFIFASRPSVAAEVLPVASNLVPGVPTAYDMVDFHGLRVQRELELAGESQNKHALVMTEFELALVRMADVTVAITDDEAAMIEDLVPKATIVTVPNIHESPASDRGFAHRSGVVFIGSFRHPPNRDAIQWLVDEIMPLVWQENPDITLHLVGSDLPDDIVEPDVERVRVHGWLESLDGLYDEVRLSVAPLRYGAGMKGKIGDSLIRGVPVVTTAVGAEGFGEVADVLRVEDTAAGIAREILALHDDELEWTALASQGQVLTEDRFGRSAARRALETMVDALGDHSPPQHGEER